MKNVILATFTLLVMGIFLSIDPVIAGVRYKVYELAESGMTIEFKKSPEEIAADDVENARRAAIREADNNRPQERLNIFEMGESGQTVSFPKTVEEIATEDNENVRLAAIRKAKSEEQKKQAVIYELGEGGDLIEFPVKTHDSSN
ncbi:MAG: hypothetical protein R3274_04635 [Desulfobacterales bacterium]|nr:hypothetical protein [Desulfobacterales bacterium]